MYLNKIDKALSQATPVLYAPVHGELEPAPLNGGYRFLVGSNGLFVEAETDFYSVCFPVETFDNPNLPFGKVSRRLIFRKGKIPVSVFDQMLRDAWKTCPNEWAGNVIWTEEGYQYVRPEVLSASGGHVSYLTTSYPLVWDVHSHGTFPSFFSATDNKDDKASGVYLSTVIGNVHHKEYSICSRMVVYGHFFDLSDPLGFV